LIIIH